MVRQDHPPLTCIVTEDRLSSHAPPSATLHADDLHSRLGVKAGAQALLLQPVPAAEPTGRVTYDERHDRAAGLRPRCRLVNDVPLHASKAEVRGNGIESWESGDAKGQPCSGVTD